MSAPTPEALTAVADWMDECIKCGRMHELRTLKNADGSPYRVSWADPDDGHGYYRRVSGAASLRAEAARLREQVAP